MANHHFISYSRRDGQDFAFRLHDTLEAGLTPFSIWLDQRDLRGVQGDWDTQIADAIGLGETLLFVMTQDSVRDQSVCKLEWARALSFKKPVIPLLFDRAAQLPFRLSTRQYIDFTDSFDAGIARLRQELQWLKTPEGILHVLKARLADAERDLQYEQDQQRRQRIESDIDALNKDIAQQQELIDNPQAAKDRTEKSIQAGLERERTPEKLVGRQKTKFINPPPGIAPSYFQDRHAETRIIGDFLKNDAQRLITVIGRGGIGKTAMVCRLLKSLESGKLPEDGGDLPVKGIVYLSATGTHRLTTPNLYVDLCSLLPDEAAETLENLYKTPTLSTEAKMQALLEQFPDGPIVLLLDNFEDVLDQQTRKISDSELNEALNAILELPHHGLKVIITTRVPPQELMLVHPEHQKPLHLDEGLPVGDVKNMLREMDTDGKIGLKTVPDAQFDQIFERTRGYPRALEALSAALAADRDTTLDDMLSVAKKVPDNVVQALVGEAFNRLDSSAEKVMQSLAIYARPVTPAAVDYLLQPYLPEINSTPILSRLVNMQFVRRETGRYYLHPVDRDYALSRVPRGEKSDQFESGTPLFTQYALRNRAADYFREARKPSAEWKMLEDLRPQLDEFDLRYEAEDYDAAADILTEIDFDYLQLWGFYRLTAELHERIQGKISDPTLNSWSLGNLGSAYLGLGRIQEAITCYEQALATTREAGNRLGESVLVNWLGNCYSQLGQVPRAIEYYEESLTIARELGDRHNEDIALSNLANCYSHLGQIPRAIEFYNQALAIDLEVGDRRGEGIDQISLANRFSELGQIPRAIEHYTQGLAILRELGDRGNEGTCLVNLAETLADAGRYSESIGRLLESLKIAGEIDDPVVKSYANVGLARAYMASGDVAAARQVTQMACQADVPQNNHNAFAMLGIVALREDDSHAAQEAFTKSMSHVDQMLAHTTQNYDALDTKWLVLCGLALCEGNDKYVPSALETLKQARVIVEADGVVNRMKEKFEALAICDTAGLLNPVREALAT